MARAVRLSARPATLADAAWLLRLRNDPATIAASRGQRAVEGWEHTVWLKGCLQDNARALMVVVRRGRRVGIYRLDGLGSAEVELSLTVAPEWRGRGFARLIVALAMRHARQHGYAGSTVRALVRAENAPSLIAFLHNGFVPTGFFDGLVRMRAGTEGRTRRPSVAVG
jgi:GNAT superfamily N-acetyltransferase